MHIIQLEVLHSSTAKTQKGRTMSLKPHICRRRKGGGEKKQCKQFLVTETVYTGLFMD